MTSLLKSPLGGSRKPDVGARGDGLVGAPSLPQVNLLPNEIRAARGIRSLQKVLILAIVAVLLVVAGAYLLTMRQAGAAQDDYAREQGRTSDLLTEQRRYADVPVVLGQLNTAVAALAASASTEILWKDYLDAITAVTPDTVTIDNLAVEALSPLEEGPPTSDPLQQQAAARITLSAWSLALPDTAEWIDQLETVPGFGDVRVYMSQRSGIDAGVAYETVVTIDVSSEAFANRFSAEVVN